MGKVLTIAKKDFLSIVKSPMFFILAGLCCSIWSFLYFDLISKFAAQSFATQAQMGGAAPGMSIHLTVFGSHIGVVNLLLLFIVPAFTMRLVAEEKRVRTFDLLMTAPLNATEIAVGKFLAGWSAVSTLILISLFYPLATSLIAEFNFAPLFTAYTGLILMGGLYVAIGLFASSLTDNVLLAIVFSVVFNLVWFFIGQGAGGDGNSMLSAMLTHMAVGPHFYSFISGTVKLSAMVYFVSIIFLFTFLSQRVIETSRWR